MIATTPLRLLCILAHPDDESLGFGGTLARYAAEGVATSIVTATRGERGWPGVAAEYPGPTALGDLRAAELRAAATVLGAGEVAFLDYLDGDLDQADPAEALARLVAQIRRIRPQVVLTFGPDGAYGHPDHIAISQLATAAAVCAADPCYAAGDDRCGADAAHRVSKLYYRVWSPAELAAYEAVFGDLVMPVDGVARRGTGWADWSITTRIDTAAHWPTVWRAVSCHRTQLPGYEALAALPAGHHRALWGTQCFYRAFSAVNGGRTAEDDLFVGLR